jgi:hypothetical protein
MIRRLAAAVSIVALMSCSMPSTVVRTTDTRPSLAIEGAPDGAILYVDGLKIGEAVRYDGQPNVLLVEPGTHAVSVKGPDGTPLLERKVYVESELKTLKVH